MSHDHEVQTKILLVDDRHQNLLALQTILEPLGQDLVSAVSGEAALKRLLEDEFAVILLDVVMPGLDGFQTAAAIKGRERTKYTPIIFLTAASQQEQQVFRGYDIGCVDYITKPFNPDILRMKVAVFVDLFRKNAQIRRQDELLRQNEQRERIRAVAEQKRLGEQIYQTLADSMPQIVWTADADGHLTYTNERSVEFTGLDCDALRARGWQAVLHPQDADEFVRGWSRAVRAQEDYEASYRLKRASDGTYRWHLWRALPVRTSDGEISSWIGTSTDIDDHERAAGTLSCLAEASKILSSSLDYRSALSRLPRVLIPLLADSCTIDLLTPTQQIETIASLHTDSEQAEALKSIVSEFPPRLTDRHGAGHVMSTGTSELISCVNDDLLAGLAQSPRHLQRLHRLELFSFVCAPILARGKILGAVSLATSESRRRCTSEDLMLVEDLARRIANAIDNAELYETAERERLALQQAHAAKDEFLAVVSHELRSPLNAILGWAQLMRMGRLDREQYDRGLETIERNACAQRQLIADLLDVSRIIAGKLELVLQSVDLRGVIESAIETIRPTARSKGVELVTALDAAVPPLSGDPFRLQQIAWNLLSNAVKFTPTGGRVYVLLSCESDCLTMQVRDTGAGIRPEFLPFVFERFRQADSSTTRSHGGLGLGLSIVRHLTELHGGRVHAESPGEGRGASFTVELFAASALGVRGRQPRVQSIQVVSRAQRTNELAGLRILLVEDLPDGRELFSLMVEEAGAKVVAVGTAQEAFDAVQASPPDILVSDIGLPGGDGFSLIARVRSLSTEGGGSTPAIAMTAHASEGDQHRALTTGFQGYIAKPVDRNELVELIRHVASGAARQPVL